MAADRTGWDYFLCMDLTARCPVAGSADVDRTAGFVFRRCCVRITALADSSLSLNMFKPKFKTFRFGQHEQRVWRRLRLSELWDAVFLGCDVFLAAN